MNLSKTLLHTTDTYIRKLHEVGIDTVEDFLALFPRDFEDTSDIISRFIEINVTEKQTVQGKIETLTEERTRNGKLLTKAILSDTDGNTIECVWFGRRMIATQFHTWDTVIIFWKPKYEYGRLSFVSADIEYMKENRRAIRPIYSDVNYIPWTWIREKMLFLKSFLEEDFPLFQSDLPEEIRKKRHMRSRRENIQALHFPTSSTDFLRAREELGYEELFHFQYRGIAKKHALEEESLGNSLMTALDSDLMRELIGGLPFALTDKQKIVLFQILKDMEKPHAMMRLLQGDVGTGKTIVALLVAIHMILSHREKTRIQVAFMVPTEILASQHFQNSENLLRYYGITSALLTGSIAPKEKESIKDQIRGGDVEILFGTHALIQDSVRFASLGFVIVDEQHRFGVEQRKALEHFFSGDEKNGFYPHRLNMSATPIPRTLALTLYGDQDISVLNEYPVGRKPIHTKIVKSQKREEVYRFIEELIREWQQVYWISPLVTESETLDIANATSMRDALVDAFPMNTVGLIHGKMSGKEKDRIMQDFYDRKIQILSSTSVVEVGVDNPNATVICIEGAERFGLSQLHQLRGRVGRGDLQSYCYLFPSNDTSTERLRAMENTNDGFVLAEIDLELRGPWEVYGIRQSGVPDLHFASLRDLDLIGEIREEIESWIREGK